MKKTGLASAVGVAALLLNQSAIADSFIDDITWVPQIGVQYKNLEFDQKITDVSGNLDNDKGDLDADLPSLTVSFTAIYKKGYLSFKYEESLSDVHTDSDIPFTNSSTDVEREDYSITAVYNVWNGFTVFVGYMDGETTFTPEAQCPVADAVGIVDPFCDASTAPFGQFAGNLAQDHLVQGLGEYSQTYQEDGFFLGGSYAWKFSDVGTLSVSLAYADLDSEYTDNYLGKGSGADFKFDGDATGLSYGINWSQPLTKRMGYYIDLRRQDYDIDSKDANGNFPGVKADSEEVITTFTAGLRWFF